MIFAVNCKRDGFWKFAGFIEADSFSAAMDKVDLLGEADHRIVGYPIKEAYNG